MWPFKKRRKEELPPWDSAASGTIAEANTPRAPNDGLISEEELASVEFSNWWAIGKQFDLTERGIATLLGWLIYLDSIREPEPSMELVAAVAYRVHASPRPGGWSDSINILLHHVDDAENDDARVSFNSPFMELVMAYAASGFVVVDASAFYPLPSDDDHVAKAAMVTPRIDISSSRCYLISPQPVSKVDTAPGIESQGFMPGTPFLLRRTLGAWNCRRMHWHLLDHSNVYAEPPEATTLEEFEQLVIRKHLEASTSS